MNDFIQDRHKEDVRAHALALGFAACGFTSAEPLGCGPQLAEWLEHGRHGHMDYLARDLTRRLEPRAWQPNASSVLVLASPYNPPPPSRSDWRKTLTGRIAAYALGLDYHDVLGERARALATFVTGLCGGSVRVHVDAGPLVEKELARRAGLGWYGHNTNLLTRAKGSYLLLACLLTEARFEPDPPFAPDHCGTCRACLPGCPTGALDEGPTIDARLCISYLTIEHRGPIDPALRGRMANWVFGCDVCQEVCPWNSHLHVPAHALSEPYLPDLLRISEEQLKTRFGGTAVMRAKRSGLARNAAVALGNSGNPEAVEPLTAALRGHDEAIVRAHAAWALGRIGTAAAQAALAEAVRHEHVPPVLREAEAALASARTDGQEAPRT